MKEIDMANWSRKEIFEFFSHTSKPFFSVTFRQDVSPVHRFAKANGLSFYYCMIWLVTKALNRVEAFRYTFSDGKVLLLDRREPSFTDMKADAEFFHICTMNIHGDIVEFCAEAKAASKNQSCFINYSDERANLVYLSCLPWLDITGLTNEGELDRDDCIPRISWGRFVPEGDRLMLGISVEANHRFIDGADIGKFSAELDKLMAELG